MINAKIQNSFVNDILWKVNLIDYRYLDIKYTILYFISKYFYN